MNVKVQYKQYSKLDLLLLNVTSEHNIQKVLHDFIICDLVFGSKITFKESEYKMYSKHYNYPKDGEIAYDVTIFNIGQEYYYKFKKIYDVYLDGGINKIKEYLIKKYNLGLDYNMSLGIIISNIEEF